MKTLLSLLLIILCFYAVAQYPPAAGVTGTTAIHADSSIFTQWASDCSVTRGLMQCDSVMLGYSSFGTVNDALGKADNNVISLGDGGTAVLTFNIPVRDGQGADFAVFENSFNDFFLELAYVSVSSNGTDFFRFPSVSLTQTDSQVTSFGTLDPTLIHNLAGKYRAMYGTPFDLSELPEDAALDKNNITHIRITDVTGITDPETGSRDSQGNLINDPWPTPFNTGGFDLDAVGIINDASNVQEISDNEELIIYPNPAKEYLKLKPGREFSEGYSVIFYNLHGSPALVYNSNESESAINITDLPAGIYQVRVTGNNIEKSARIARIR